MNIRLGGLLKPFSVIGAYMERRIISLQVKDNEPPKAFNLAHAKANVSVAAFFCDLKNYTFHFL